MWTFLSTLKNNLVSLVIQSWLWNNKRAKITLTSVILSLGVFFISSISFQMRSSYLISLIVLTYGLSVWSLFYKFRRIEYLTLFVLPVFITIDASLIFYEFDRFFQDNLLLRLLCAMGYGSLLYISLLVENIFNVSSERNIPLLRAGHTVGYLATLVVVLIEASLLHNLNLPPWSLAILIFLSLFALLIQALWQTELEEHISFDIALSSLILATIGAEIALAFSFWPLNPLSFGLTQTLAVYLFIGLKQHQIKNNLTSGVVKEYLIMGSSIFLLLLFITSWRG